MKRSWSWSRPRPTENVLGVCSHPPLQYILPLHHLNGQLPSRFHFDQSTINQKSIHLCCDCSSLQNVVHHCKIVSVDCNESMYHNQSQSTPIPLNDTWYYTSRLSSTVYQSNFMQHLSIGARHQSTLKWWWIAIAKESMHVDGRSSWCSLSSIDWI